MPQLRDQRYEAVVHLVTAAIGAERFYTLENNKARMVRSRRPAVLRRLHARSWVVSFSSLRPFGPSRCPAQESRPEAIALDGRLARAWVGHNALHVVENGTGSFEEKMRRTVLTQC